MNGPGELRLLLNRYQVIMLTISNLSSTACYMTTTSDGMAAAVKKMGKITSERWSIFKRT